MLLHFYYSTFSNVWIKWKMFLLLRSVRFNWLTWFYLTSIHGHLETSDQQWFVFLYVHYFTWVDIVSHFILFTTLFYYVELKMEFLISGMTGIIRFLVPTCPGKSLEVLEFLLQILGLWNILENHCGPWKSWKVHHDMIMGTAGLAISFNLTSLLCRWVALCSLNI